MVDLYSSLADVMVANVVDYADITDSVDKWNYLTVYNTSANPPSTCDETDCSGSNGDYDFFRIGLFAHDLADFRADCTLSQNCNVSDYYQFDGWSIGMYSKAGSATTEDQGFCTTADKDCVVINETSGVFSITSFASAVLPDKENPTT
jgi:hypothetical protein